MNPDQVDENVIKENEQNDSTLPQAENIDVPNLSESPKSTSTENGKNTCGCMNNENHESSPINYIYAIGTTRPVFRSLSVEKEFVQLLGKSTTSGLTDSQVFKNTIMKKENRYLIRQICWVLNVEGLDAYVLNVMDMNDIDYLIDSFNPTAETTDTTVVIGFRGPLSRPEMCGGLSLPVAVVSNMYTFDVDSLLKTLPKPPKIAERNFRFAAKEVFDRITQLADNFGGTDEHRALNYLAVRYNAIYSNAAEMFLNDNNLYGVEVIHSRLSLTRKIEDVIFSYVNRKTDVITKFYTRVDVTEEFPFLVTKLSPYYDR